jgi:hypothetical protein
LKKCIEEQSWVVPERMVSEVRMFYDN